MHRPFPTGMLVSGLVLLLGAGVWPRAGAQPVINEYVASNINGIVDEDGDASDWLEIYNPGPGSVDLTGYGLSDDPDEPFQWVFPEMIIPVDDHLLIFASDKDRRIGAAHWETVIDWGEVWKYRANGGPPPPAWREPWYDDTYWPAGPSGIGYGDADDATQIPACISACLRKTFPVDDPGAVRYVCLHVDFDDAFVAYLNGVEIARANISSPGPPQWDQPADEGREALIYQGGWPEMFLLADVAPLLQAGGNLLAIEVHNTDIGSSDMTLIPFLTLGLDEVPPGAQGVADFIRPLIPRLHTNFKIAAEGETLTLCDSLGVVLDLVDTGHMYADISRGRTPDGGTEWHLFTEPTPDKPNGEGGYVDYAIAPEFSIPRGLYTGALSLELSVSSPDAIIYYTLDGGVPTEESLPYSNAIPITQTRAVRARAFEAGYLPSHIITHSYVLNDATTLPVVSLVTDPPNLWDPETGIYFEENIWEDWERPMHYEFFEADGTPGFALDAGVKIHGGWSRTFPQKSLRLMARAGYGTAAVEYPLFAERDFGEFRRLILRNSGNDWLGCHFRDALMHRLVGHTGLEYQAYRPARAYLNGEYWGIYNFRERIDKYFLESNAGADPDSVDLLEHDGSRVIEGDNEHYFAMIQFLEESGVADSANYAYIQTQMDIPNFQTYGIFEIFYANTDWPGNNIKFWRPRTATGRWRWLIFDLDFGLGLAEGHWHNTLAFALEPDGPDWPNPPWSTFLLRRLLENEDFRQMFINRYCDHLNSSFVPQRTMAMAQQVADGVAAEVPRHLARWEMDPGQFDWHVAIVLDFLQRRLPFARGHLQQEFGLYNSLTLFLDVAPPGGGSIRLTAIEIDSTWSGTYLETVPIPLTAVAAPGYDFASWSDPTLPQQESVVILPEGDYEVTALFEESGVAPGVVMINEINYHPADAFDTQDWVELYNKGEASLDLTGWQFKDEQDAHVFSLPDGFILEAGSYVVLCEDTTAFGALFPGVAPILGDLGFGFGGGGELLRLFDSQGELYDWVEYDDDPPWPPEPDGSGPTLELISPDLDNTLAESWAASTGHGTPGERNSAWQPGDASPAQLAPLVLSLQRAVPNPTPDLTFIRFSLDRERDVRLGVYGVSGRLLHILVAGRFDPGVQRVEWTGRDDRGRLLPAGVYFVCMESEGFRAARKVLLVR